LWSLVKFCIVENKWCVSVRARRADSPGVSLEALSNPPLQSFLVELQDDESPERRTSTRSKAKKAKSPPAPAPASQMQDPFPYTPIPTLTTDGMEWEQIWSQLELKTQNIIRALSIITPEALLDTNDMLDELDFSKVQKDKGLGGGDEDEEGESDDEDDESDEDDLSDDENGEEMTEEEFRRMMMEGGDSEDGSGSEDGVNFFDDAEMDDDEDSEDDEKDEVDVSDDDDEEDSIVSEIEGQVDLGEYGEEESDEEDEDRVGEEEEVDENEEADLDQDGSEMDEDMEDVDATPDDEVEDDLLPIAGPSRTKRRHPTLDDDFFSIDQFNQQTELLEAGRVTSGVLAGDEDGEELEDLGVEMLQKGDEGMGTSLFVSTA
jgi:U3 small nucleolar RNA-associated protein MPP10